MPKNIAFLFEDVNRSLETAGCPLRYRSVIHLNRTYRKITGEDTWPGVQPGKTEYTEAVYNQLLVMLTDYKVRQAITDDKQQPGGPHE